MLRGRRKTESQAPRLWTDLAANSKKKNRQGSFLSQNKCEMYIVAIASRDEIRSSMLLRVYSVGAWSTTPHAERMAEAVRFIESA